jgi:hypothetical protein
MEWLIMANEIIFKEELAPEVKLIKSEGTR